MNQGRLAKFPILVKYFITFTTGIFISICTKMESLLWRFNNLTECGMSV